MAIPTLSTVSPPSGPTRGAWLLEIHGSGFRLPPLPAAGTWGWKPVPKSMRVTIGGVEASNVQVFSVTELTCLAPPHVAGVCPITVENLDDDGAPIAGETATAPDAVTFLMPSYTDEAANASGLLNLTVAFVRALQRDLVREARFAVSTDYRSEDGRPVMATVVEKFPAIVVMGPGAKENLELSVPDEREVRLDDGTFVKVREPAIVDIEFELRAISDKHSELVNLQHNLLEYFRAGASFGWLRTPGDLSTLVSTEMGAPDGWSFGVQGNRSNNHTLEGRVELRRVALSQWAGIPLTTIDGVPASELLERGYPFEQLVLELTRLPPA